MKIHLWITLQGFDHGKLYVATALDNFLKTKFPNLQGEHIAIWLESDTEPTLDLLVPSWFSWDDPNGGILVPIEPIAL